MPPLKILHGVANFYEDLNLENPLSLLVTVFSFHCYRHILWMLYFPVVARIHLRCILIGWKNCFRQYPAETGSEPRESTMR